MRIVDNLITVVTVFFILSFCTITLINTGTVNIEKPYYDEYQETSDNLEICQEALEEKVESIKCPAVECKPGASGILIGIMGTLWGLVGFGMWLYSSQKAKKLDDKNKEKRK